MATACGTGATRRCRKVRRRRERSALGRTSGCGRPQGLGREPPRRAPSCPEPAVPGMGTGDEGWLCLASPPLLPRRVPPGSFPPHYLNAQLFALFPPPPQPETLQASALAVYGSVERFVGLYKDFGVYSLPFVNENLSTLTSEFPSHLSVQTYPGKTLALTH